MRTSLLAFASRLRRHEGPERFRSLTWQVGSNQRGGRSEIASLLIRTVDEALHTRLKARAAEHRRLLEEEARELLRAAVARQETVPRENLVEIARRLFGPEHGLDLDIPPRGGPRESPPPDFTDPKYDR